MSDRQKFPHFDAMTVANGVMAELAFYCEPGRCVVAGSLRRGKPLVSDVEILYVPRLSKEQDKDALFGSVEVNLADDRIKHLLANVVLDKRLSVDGVATWGPRNKLAVHAASGIPVDLFATTEKDWWVSLVVRTGSKETNLALTAGARALGKTLMAYGEGVKDLATGEVTAARSEEEVFALCGLNYLKPEDR